MLIHADAHVRQAHPDDAHSIDTLYRLLVPGSPVHVDPFRLAALQADPRAFLLVAEAEAHILGTAFLCLCPDPMYGAQPFAVVENVVVCAAARGRGIGGALLHAVETLALEADCSKIMLSSSSQRTDAHAFFCRAGFQASKLGFVKYRRDFIATA